jgi:exopolyphosphatase/guanosine-5'-triphosphate,3'-diphosphate pyrophosphatase
MSRRYATIDIGTNSVLLLVAERGPDQKFKAVLERAEITRLGRGVDATRRLSAEGQEDTLKVLEAFAREAKAAGAQELAVTATSAARDAQNGAEFLAAAKARAGLDVEIISGDQEAQLSYASAWADFGSAGQHKPLVVIDIGGGSTELIYGDESAAGKVGFRQSFDVGSVRLTERLIKADPPSAEEQKAVRAHLRETFATLPRPPLGFRLVGVAGTVTTLFALQHKLTTYDPAKVHGGTLTITQLDALAKRLCSLPLEKRRKLPGLQPKRADVICAGAFILLCALERLASLQCWVSDRGLRWGLLAQRFGQG